MIPAINTLSLFTVFPCVFAALAALSGFNFGTGQTTDVAPSPVSQSDIESDIQRPAFFARLAYCSPDAVTSLSCGEQCDAVSDIEVLHAGGDEGAVPRCNHFLDIEWS